MKKEVEPQTHSRPISIFSIGYIITKSTEILQLNWIRVLEISII